MRGLSIGLLLIVCATAWQQGSQGQQPEQADCQQQTGALSQGSEGTARKRAQCALQHAEFAERELRFGEALDSYQQAFRDDPSAPFAPTARHRLRWLQQRSEGDFAPLAKVETVRRDPSRLANLHLVSELDQQAASFPPGLMRSEAWLLVADAYSRLLQRPVQAADAWRRVLEDTGAGNAEKTIALGGVVDQALGRGDLGQAAQAVRTWGDVAPGLRAKVLRLQRRSWLLHGAIAVMVLVGISAVVAIARVVQRFGPSAVRWVFTGYAAAIGGWIAIGGAALAWTFERAAMPTFLVFGLGIVMLICVGRAWHHALSTRGARAAAALVGALAVAALAVLAMLTSPALAEGFGL